MHLRQKLVAGVVSLAAITLVSIDATRAPSRQLGATLTVAGIHTYRRVIAHVFPTTCRFTATCSRYTKAVVREFGWVRGAALATRRLARCRPWTPPGTHDPPPR